MRIKSIKNKKIVAAIGIVTLCTVLITAGVLKLVNNSNTESSVESLEKSKISNLFNIRQEGDKEENSSGTSRVTYRTASSSETSTNDISSAQQSTSTTTKQAKAPVKAQTSSSNAQTAQTSSSNAQTAQKVDENQNPIITPASSDKQDESNNANKTGEPVPPANTTIPDVTSGYTIKIKNAIPGHTYKAYQIFQGDLYEPTENGVITKKVLSNIKWGKAFEDYADDIIAKLQETYNVLYDECKTAADVADILAKNESHANQFSIIVGNIINDPNNNISTEHTTSNKASDDIYAITGLEPGYYIVIDSEIANRDDAYSRYFLNVVSNVEMEVKAIVPFLKKIVSGGVKIDDTHNTETYYGDNDNYGLIFSLNATIPTNQTENNSSHSKDYLAEYENYEYRIVDIVDKGFDLEKDDENIPKVIVKDSEGNILENITYTVEKITDANKNLYKIDDLTPYAEKTIFGITINNLKGLVADENINLNPGDVLTFEYKAKLNGEHNVGDIPNVNEAYLIYSDNPHNSGSKSRTTENKTYTYSIDLELSKIAELKNEGDEKVSLPNAVFEIYKDDKKSKIAELTDSNESDPKGYFKYTSLGVGTYYIIETKAPDGYNKLKDDIKLVITSDLDNDTIKWNVSIEKNSEVNKLVHLTNEKTEENPNNNGTKVVEKDGVNYRSIFIEIENTSGATLPVTGGIGTIIFTVVGLSIMIIAVICLKSNKRK